MDRTQFLDRALQGEIFPDIPQQIESDRALSAWSQSLCTKWLEMTGKLQGFGGQRYMNLSEGCNYYEHNKKTTDKQVLIVEGGPGTGKSVVAVNLLANLTREGMVAKYVSKNAAPRSVYSTKLRGTIKKRNIDNLFGGSGSFTVIVT